MFCLLLYGWPLSSYLNLMDPGSDPKAARRKRVSRACDRCRSKKVRVFRLAVLFGEMTVLIDDAPLFMNTQRVYSHADLKLLILRTNVTVFVPHVPPARLRARPARMIPMLRNVDYLRAMFEDWRSCGLWRFVTSMVLRTPCWPCWAQPQIRLGGGIG